MSVESASAALIGTVSVSELAGSAGGITPSTAVAVGDSVSCPGAAAVCSQLTLGPNTSFTVTIGADTITVSGHGTISNPYGSPGLAFGNLQFADGKFLAGVKVVLENVSDPLGEASGAFFVTSPAPWVYNPLTSQWTNHQDTLAGFGLEDVTLGGNGADGQIILQLTESPEPASLAMILTASTSMLASAKLQRCTPIG